MIDKTKLVLSIAVASLTVMGITVSDDAMAHSRKYKHKHHSTSHRSGHATNYHSGSNETALLSKVDVLEAQLRAMQDEVASLKAGAGQGSEATKVQELDAWMQESKTKPAKVVHDNMIFFRGGYARNDSYRNDLLTGGQFGGDNVPNVLGGGKTHQGAYYVGAGFDFGLTDDVWGMMANTEVDAELMFEYKNFGSRHFKNNPAIVQPGITNPNTGTQTGVNPNAQNGPLCTLIQYASNDELNGITNGAGSRSCNSVTVTQFSLTAAPKFKFLKGSKFRPWLIPFGLGIHVISPPSNGVTVLTPGVMFAGGAEYAVWKDIKLGADVRYHYTGSDVDGVNASGLTAGGYLGIGF